MTVDEEIKHIRQWRDGQVYALSRVESEVYQRILITACIDSRQLFYHEKCSSAPAAAHLQEYVSFLSEEEARLVMNLVQIVISATRGEEGYDLVRR